MSNNTPTAPSDSPKPRCRASKLIREAIEHGRLRFLALSNVVYLDTGRGWRKLGGLKPGVPAREQLDAIAAELVAARG
jgi:hypothetical protein